MIDVTMREHDRGGSHSMLEAAGRLADDRFVGGGRPRIHEHPRPVPRLGRTDEVDVEDGEREARGLPRLDGTAALSR